MLLQKVYQKTLPNVMKPWILIGTKSTVITKIIFLMKRNSNFIKKKKHIKKEKAFTLNFKYK